MINSTTDLLTLATSKWLTSAALQLSHEALEFLHRALADPDLEVSVRIQLKGGRLVLEASTATHRTELLEIQVEPIRPDDGFGHDDGRGATH